MRLIPGEHVFAGKMRGRLICLEARTGKQVWETDKVTDVANGVSTGPSSRPAKRRVTLRRRLGRMHLRGSTSGINN